MGDIGIGASEIQGSRGVTYCQLQGGGTARAGGASGVPGRDLLISTGGGVRGGDDAMLGNGEAEPERTSPRQAACIKPGD